MSHDLSICKVCGVKIDPLDELYFRTEYGHEVCCTELCQCVDKKQLGKYIKRDYKLYIKTKNKVSWLDDCGIDFDDPTVVESIDNMSDNDLGTKYFKLCTEFNDSDNDDDYDDERSTTVPDEIINWS